MESTNVAPGFEQNTRPQSQQQREESTSSSNPCILPETLEQKQEQRRQARSEVYRHPEGKVAQPHRCNDRLEDVIQALFEGSPRKNLPGPARLFYQCLQSNPGEEPSDPFFYLKIDPPGAGKTETPK
ncbi:unnamed protein product [Calypogeia fissa]